MCLSAALTVNGIAAASALEIGLENNSAWSGTFTEAMKYRSAQKFLCTSGFCFNLSKCMFRILKICKYSTYWLALTLSRLLPFSSEDFFHKLQTCSFRRLSARIGSSVIMRYYTYIFEDSRYIITFAIRY